MNRKHFLLLYSNGSSEVVRCSRFDLDSIVISRLGQSSALDSGIVSCAAYYVKDSFFQPVFRYHVDGLKMCNAI